MRTTLAIVALFVVSAALALDLPDNCLWIEGGQVKSQGAALKLPPPMTEATAVERLQAVGKGLVVWVVEQRDPDGAILQFALHLADVQAGTDQLLISGVDPFEQGSEWWLQRTQLSETGRALYARIRLTGTGGFTEVYKFALDGSGMFFRVPEDTVVWSDLSADGSVRVRPTWGLTPDAPHLADNQRKFGSLIVADRRSPQGRWLWKIARHDRIPPWADREIDGAALSPDTRRIAYTCATGLWVADVAGGEPRRLVGPGSGDVMFGDPVWARDGRGVYFTGTRLVGSGTRKLLGYAPLHGEAPPPNESAYGLCLPRL